MIKIDNFDMDYVAEIAKTKLPFKPVELNWAKRLFDILFSLVLILLLSPFILLVMVFSILESIFFPDSRGPVFYSETRISKGQPFKVYKFRIFKTHSSQKYFKEHGFIQTKALEEDTKNITFTGRVLKQIYMDELPQIFNVLKGDMTLVGPRPSNEVVTWEDGQSGKFQRYLFKGGITGPFQILKGTNKFVGQSEIDMDYIIFCRDNPAWKILLKDSQILVQTVITVVKAKGV